MSNAIRFSFQPVACGIIAKLVKAGYLQPAAHNNADAITNAISRMKHDLRGCGDREDGPRAVGASVTSDVTPFHERLSKRPAREIALSAPSAAGFQCRPAAGPINSLSKGGERRGIGFCYQRQRRCRCLHERSCVGTCNSENDRPPRVALNPSARLPLKHGRS